MGAGNACAAQIIPRQFDPREVDEALLGAFWARGYARTSIEDLCQSTGLLRGSLYAAYGSKENIFRAATKRYVADLAAALATDKVGLDAVSHVLDTVVRLTVQDRDRRGCLILNAIPESHALSIEAREQLRDGLRAIQILLRTRLREAQTAAGTDVDLDALAAMLFASSVAIRVLGRAGHNTKQLQNIAKGAISAARQSFERTQRH